MNPTQPNEHPDLSSLPTIMVTSADLLRFSNEPQPPNPPQPNNNNNSNNNQITLQVGERRFMTTRRTLTTESTFFASLLSGRWENNTLSDGSYFIDADPDLFSHILRYLRRGVLPVFHDMEKGHDHALYLALLREATYFGIERLEEWLEKKRYLSAVKVAYSVDEVDGGARLSKSLDTDATVEYFPQWGTKKVYVCPRGISVHREDPGRCGRQCSHARGGADDVYDEEPVLTTLVVKKRVVLDMEACLLD